MKQKNFLKGMLGFALLAFVVPTALAAEFIAPSESDEGMVTLSSGQAVHNLYVVGATLNLSQQTAGDLVAAGGTVNVDNSTEADAIIAGGTVNVRGDIGGDVRAAGGTVNFRNPIGGDLLVAGGTVTIDQEATVGGDLVASGGTVVARSDVSGKININASTVILGGSLSGDVVVRAQKLVVEPSASIAKLTYYGPGQPEIQNGAQVGALDVKTLNRHEGNQKAWRIGGFIFQLIAWIIAGLVFVWVFKGRSKAIAALFSKRPLVNLGVGFLALIAPPIAAVICFMAFGLGYYVGITILFLYAVLMLMAFVAGFVTAGGWVIKKLTKRDTITIDWQAAIIGAALVSLVCFVPFIGPLAIFVLFLFALGATLRDLIHTEQGRNRAS